MNEHQAERVAEKIRAQLIKGFDYLAIWLARPPDGSPYRDVMWSVILISPDGSEHWITSFTEANIDLALVQARCHRLPLHERTAHGNP